MSSGESGSDATRLRILHAITESIENMTVSQISAAAGISRQTFYSLFASKYDIAYWYLEQAESRYLFQIGRTLSLSEGLLRYFEFLEKERPCLANAFERNPDKKELRERLNVPINEFLWTAASKGVEIDSDFKFCVSYTVESANCLVAGWCIHGSETDDAQSIARRLEMCVPRCLAVLAEPE